MVNIVAARKSTRSVTVISCLFLTINLALQAQNQPILKQDKAAFDHAKRHKPLTGNATAFKPLQGGISLSHRLAPTPASLHTGAIFNKANIPKTPIVNGWYWIPSWMAGVWHRETVTDIAENGRETIHTERADHLWGHQSDRFGNVWHHHTEPYIQTVEQENSTSSKTITLLQPVKVTASQVTLRYKDITVEFTTVNNTITRTYQHEQISQLSRQKDQLFEEVWAKNFDQDGKCFQSNHSKILYTLIHPFRATKFDKTGLDLEKNFKQFLLSHGFSERVPISNTEH